MKKIVMTVLIVIQVSFSLFSQEKKDIFQIDWITDGVIIGASLALNVTPFLFKDEILNSQPDVLNIETINALDRFTAKQYSKGFDITGDILQYMTFLVPTILITTEKDQWLTIGIMYVEAATISYGVKNLGKALVSRYRPYNYFPNAPQVDDDDFMRSFPSGHTAMAFTGASFASYVFSQYFPESRWKIPLIAGSFTLAAGTAVSRMLSGNHFFSDVLGGAIIGSLSGFLIPYMHKTENSVNKYLARHGNEHIQYKANINISYCSFEMNF